MWLLISERYRRAVSKNGIIGIIQCNRQVQYISGREAGSVTPRGGHHEDIGGQFVAIGVRRDRHRSQGQQTAFSLPVQQSVIADILIRHAREGDRLEPIMHGTVVGLADIFRVLGNCRRGHAVQMTRRRRGSGVGYQRDIQRRSASDVDAQQVTHASIGHLDSIPHRCPCGHQVFGQPCGKVGIVGQ